jgi:hypothetical protein
MAGRLAVADAIGCRHLVPWGAADGFIRLAGPFLTS